MIKSFLACFAFGLLAACASPSEASSSTGESALESECHTDGCVFRKQAELAAVVAFVGGAEECGSMDFWPWAFEKVSDTDYAWTCGYSYDPKETPGHQSFAQRLLVRVGENNAVSLVSVTPTDASSFPFSTCTSDGCVNRKADAAHAVFEWAATHDDCTSTVSWLQSYKQVGNIHYELTCGDTSKQEHMLLVNEYDDRTGRPVIRRLE